MKKIWVIIALVTLVLGGLYTYFGKNDDTQIPNNEYKGYKKTIIAKHEIYGTRLKEEEKALNNRIQYSDIAVIKLPAPTIEYLRTKSDLRDLYKQNKKIVVWRGGTGCPYGEMFADAVNKVSSDTRLTKYYNFFFLASSEITMMKQSAIDNIKSAGYEPPYGVLNEIDGWRKMDFVQSCELFCVIKPSENKLITFLDVGRDTSTVVDQWLINLANW